MSLETAPSGGGGHEDVAPIVAPEAVQTADTPMGSPADPDPAPDDPKKKKKGCLTCTDDDDPPPQKPEDPPADKTESAGGEEAGNAKTDVGPRQATPDNPITYYQAEGTVGPIKGGLAVWDDGQDIHFYPSWGITSPDLNAAAYRCVLFNGDIPGTAVGWGANAGAGIQWEWQPPAPGETQGQLSVCTGIVIGPPGGELSVVHTYEGFTISHALIDPAAEGVAAGYATGAVGP